MKIFLIGYMGSGKSTIGKLLAEKMKLDFVDLDEYIEQKTEMTIADIFKTQGEEKFRLLEHHSLKELIKKVNVVISLGGGTPCFHGNMELIRKNGISVFIQTSVATLVKRLMKDRFDRPLICHLNKNELTSFIETSLALRLPYYQKANHIMQSENLSASELTNAIGKLLK